MPKVVIVDYDMGNLGSIRNMLRRLGVTSVVSSDSREIESASHLVLPGVGSFAAGMQRLGELDLVSALTEAATHRRVPTLGVCLGMQLMTRGSEEGGSEGLGWFAAATKRFDLPDATLKVPHMGWNAVGQARPTPLLAGFEEPPRFYFVHSYHVVADDPGVVAGTTDYGYRFASVIQNGSLIGVQFHPEKSHRYGLQVLRSFVGMEASC